MRKMICQQYFWPGMGSYINRYISNCPECKRSKNSRFKPAGLLRPLLIPQKPWQYITMDFKSFNKDRHGYDAILVIMDRLGKRSFFCLRIKLVLLLIWQNCIIYSFGAFLELLKRLFWIVARNL
jgi:hypothetical protein